MFSHLRGESSWNDILADESVLIIVTVKLKGCDF